MVDCKTKMKYLYVSHRGTPVDYRGEKKEENASTNGHNNDDEREITFSFDSLFDWPCCPIWLAFCMCNSCSFSSFSLSFLFLHHADGR